MAFDKNKIKAGTLLKVNARTSPKRAYHAYLNREWPVARVERNWIVTEK
jgi:hypothetical protein